jgi:hypothetical protein
MQFLFEVPSTNDSAKRVRVIGIEKGNDTVIVLVEGNGCSAVRLQDAGRGGYTGTGTLPVQEMMT